MSPRLFAALAAILLTAPLGLRAHCDTLEGPVVVAAKDALARADVTPVLKWIQPADEDAIRSAFNETLVVRKQSTEAAGLADRYFFETLVRIHRAGEGAPYTGLKAEPVEPGIEAADHALITGKVDELVDATLRPISDGIKARFERVADRQTRADSSVAAGREYVEAYVDYIHFVERVSAMGAHAVGGHPEAGHAEVAKTEHQH